VREGAIMNLQQKILIEFQRLFPRLTLQQISKITKIERTRVFRIINGVEMKISEYEVFLKLIQLQQQKIHLKAN
jgi:predicted DNA-binding protein YlxM (UPF0122 family)